MLRYLDHWIQRELDEGKYSIYHIHDLLLLGWKESIVDQEKRIVPLILRLVQRQRNGEEVGMTQVKAVLDSFRDMSIERHDKIELEVYRNLFEKPFLHATEEYYQTKLDQDSGNDNDVDYKELVSYNSATKACEC